MTLINFLLLLTVLLIPLLGAYKNLGYEQIKIFFFISTISLIAFFWMFSKPKFKWTAISKLSGIFILVLLLSSLTGLNPKISFLGNLPYFQGWILYLYLFLFSLLVRQSKIKIEVWAFILVFTSIIVSLLAIKDWVLLNLFHASVPNYAGRVVSSFGQPNFFAGFLLLTLPFAYFLFKKGYQWIILIMIISMAGIFVSYSRAAIFLSLILFILALLDQFKIRFRYFLAVLTVLFIACVIALNFSSGFVGNEFSKPYLTNNPDLTKQSVEKRAYIWPQSINIVLEKPIIGLWAGNY